MIESVFYLNNKKILRIETILGEWKHRLTSGNKLEIESWKKKETTRMLIICFAALKDLRRVWRKISEKHPSVNAYSRQRVTF